MTKQNGKISIAKTEYEEGGITFVMQTDETLFLPKFCRFDSQIISLIYNGFY